jgi:PAS domain S-box-containing protein
MQREKLSYLSEHPATLCGEPAPLSARARLAEDELAVFFAQSLDLLCIVGFDGYLKRVNPVWTSCLGWTLEELKARPSLDFVHPDDRDATLAEVGRLSEGAETILFENRYRHRNGSYRWLRWNARSEAGRRRIYATARDVTDQKRLQREILEIADREKERLGRELHDGLCQTLAGIAALSATLSKRLAANSESAASAAATEINELLTEAISEARDLAHGMGPVHLKEAGLDAALHTLAVNVQHLFRVSCTFECDCSFLKHCVAGIATHLFRIGQEAVHNAVVHGRADRIKISLCCKDGQGLLSVRDDGVGLSADDDLDGVGLHTMAYRARLIGASLEVRRRNRRGTAVTCTFPLARTPDPCENSDHAGTNV